MKKLIALEAVILALLLVIAIALNGRQPAEPVQTDPIPQTTTTATTTQTQQQITWKTYPASRELTAKQYFVYDTTQKSYANISGAVTDRVYPASITKLFTAYVALQYLEPELVITAGDALKLVAPGSSVAQIKTGDQLTVEQLVEAMMLPSGNDAAYLLAVEAGRIIDSDPTLHASNAAQRFVNRMNEVAEELGMTDTNFVNPDGIHKSNHYTTFNDLVILASLSLKDPTIARYAGLSTDTVSFSDGEDQEWINTNMLIQPNSEYYCPYAVGLKTGQTPSAGSCLLSAFQYEGNTYIIGVFGCPEIEDRFDDTLQLFNETIGIE